MQRLRLGLPALPIALDDGGELFAMALALLGEPAADVEDVDLRGVARATWRNDSAKVFSPWSISPM